MHQWIWQSTRPPMVSIAALFVILVGSACGPTATSRSVDTSAPSTGASPQTQSDRTLNIVVRLEPASIAAKPLRSSFVKVKTTVRLFNAALDIIDDKNEPHPYLAESLPTLNTDSWRVMPDGRMETTYTLKPNLTWHDGSPLTADDFAFAYQVYATPDLGSATTLPIGAMEDVVAKDDRTFTIKWKRIYPYAGVLQATGETSAFPPMPRHILGAPFQTANWDAFANHPYWTTEFVGAGPYKLERWEAGAFIEGSAFAGHVLGKAKIDRVQVQFQNDQNSALASLLAGSYQFASDDALGIEQGVTIRHQWAPSNAGTLIVTTDLWRAIYPQLRPDLATPASLLDVRVRKALAYALDKQPLNDVLYEGEGIMATSILPPGVDYYAPAQRQAVEYGYDLRRADQLLGEVGYQKGADGIYASPTQGKLSIEMKVNASAQYEKERSIVAASWRAAGIDVTEATLAAAQSQDPIERATYPSLYAFSTGLGERSLANFARTAIPSPANRWTGTNRQGWTNAEWDQVYDTLGTTLDPSERIRELGQAVHIISDDVAAISLYYDLGAVAHVSALTGPRGIGPDSTGLVTWNVYEWELK